MSFILLATHFTSSAQDYSFLNSSFENQSGCVGSMSPPHSQFGNLVFGWENAFATNVSTADFFTVADSVPCALWGFSSLTNTVSLASNIASEGCSWAGIYLNYDDASSINSKYREYIVQSISLVSGVTYTLKVDIARSSHASSNNLEVDFGIYGYSGSIPAGQLDYCLINADGSSAPLFGNIDKNSITTNFQTFTVSFTPTQNYDYIALGGASCGTEATAIGYVFIDNVQLSASDNSIVNPVILSCSSNGLCNLRCLKESFDLEGNTPPNGTTGVWTQGANNPEQITFTSPNAPTTTILETGSFITGLYEFYYTFFNGTTTVTDTARIRIGDFDIVNDFYAGEDQDYCNGNFDSIGTSRRVRMLGTLPDDSAIEAYGANVWWSMIRNDGTEWVFPNGCNSPNGFDEGDVYADAYLLNCSSVFYGSTNSSNPLFYLRNAQDTVVFIYHMTVTDDCNTTVVMSDTMTVINNDIDFEVTTEAFPLTSVCVGQTMNVHQYTGNPNFYLLEDNPNLTFEWSYSPLNGGLNILDNTVSDSVQIVGLVSGDYIVKVEVTDASTGCIWYDVTNVNVSPCGVSAGIDLNIGCVTDRYTNDVDSPYYGEAPRNVRRKIFMNASPNDVTIRDNNMSSWWSMIRNDGSEWVFRNNCVPYDGYDEGDVSSVLGTKPCGDPNYAFPSSSNAMFNIKNALDTISFIWHIVKPNPTTGVMDTIIDTMVIYMRDIDFAYSSYANPEVPWITTCEDTLLVHQLISANIRPLANHSHLSFEWNIVKHLPNGGGFVPDLSTDGTIIDNTLSDSILVVMPSAKKYILMVEVTDHTTNCKWLDVIIVKRVTPLNIDAGVDSFACSSMTGDVVYIANASFEHQGANSQSATNIPTWWSTIRDDGSEWIFTNPCVPYDGDDEGSLYITDPTSGNSCGVSASDSIDSNTPKARFKIRFPGTRTLIWNVVDVCTGDTITDTVQIGFGVLDQANAGLDMTVDCNVVSLEGNLSSLSSANSGYYEWEQISGSDTVQILSPNDNIAYFSTAGLTPGVYEFKYTLGLAPCQTVDTIAITVVPLPNLNITMNSNYDDNAILCLNDTITFTASGGTQYAFLVNGVVEQPFSPISSFSYSRFNGVSYVTVLGKVGQTNCIETLDSAHVINAVYLPNPILDLMPSTLCEGDSLDYHLEHRIGNYTWTGPNGFTLNDSVLNIQNIDETNEGIYAVYYSENTCSGDSSFFSLTINPVYNIDFSRYICPGDSLFLNGAYQTSSGIFIDSLQSSNGCDSLITTLLNVGDTLFVNNEICADDSLFVGGAFQNVGGIYIDNFTSIDNCDSIVKTNLMINPTYQLHTDSTICNEDSVLFGNQYYDNTGTYYNSLSSISNCDSTLVLNLTVSSAIENHLNALICEGDSLLIFQNFETTDGTYSQVNIANNGCDSTSYLTLTIEEITTTTLSIQKCEGDSVWLENEYQNQSGQYFDTLATQNGCDSLIVSNLIIQPNYIVHDTLETCGQYFWNGSSENYYNSGDYTAHLFSQFGCDSTVHLNLSILRVDTTEIVFPFYCDSTLFNEEWIYYTQVIVDTLTAESGCDSLIYNYLDVRDCSTTSNFSDLYIPNVFTPGGDGTNDRFIITSKGQIISELAELTIYNRWGTKLFYSNTTMIWDGKKHSEGTYYYVFKYDGKDYHGHINLIRE